MTFTNIKLDLSHYNTSISSSGYGGCIIVIINVLATVLQNFSKFLLKLSTDRLFTTHVCKQFNKSTILPVKEYYRKSYLIIFYT